MKIESNGVVTDKFAKKINTEKDNIVCSIAIKEGENNGYDIIKVYQTRKAEMIDRLKGIEVGDKISCSGFLNCFVGESDNGKYSITTINLTYILEETNKSTEPAKSVEEKEDDLPF